MDVGNDLFGSVENRDNHYTVELMRNEKRTIGNGRSAVVNPVIREAFQEVAFIHFVSDPHSSFGRLHQLCQ